MKKRIIGLVSALALAATAAPALAQGTIKIGVLMTLSTPAAIIGRDFKDAYDLAMDQIGHKMGPLKAELVYADDEFNPQKGKQKTEKLVKSDNVDIMTGYIWSHVLLASVNTVTQAGKIIISSNAGPSPMAGKRCHKNFFNISWQNDQTPMALGEVLNQKGVKSLYIMSPNYAAGKNMAAGVERTFKGKVVGKDMTKWPAQIDWSAELSKVKAAKPDAVFIFYPGKHGPAFLKQYAEAGLNGKIPLYSVYTLDAIALPRLQKAKMTGVLGTQMTQFWVQDLDNPQNKKFVSSFRKKYGRYPSFYAAQAYDTIYYIKSAVEAVNGNLKDMDGLRAALKKADFPSVRGKFRMGNDNFPIQNFYSREVVTDSDGNWTTSVRDIVLKDHQDPYASQCKM
ncbi:MAG: ABC transporter substrate-binding protein [Alphaproteobacteria bacterium]|nr:ABC transporter substrate-binding protein [Alphaproteobacteria bacterium]